MCSDVTEPGARGQELPQLQLPVLSQQGETRAPPSAGLFRGPDSGREGEEKREEVKEKESGFVTWQEAAPKEPQTPQSKPQT